MQNNTYELKANVTKHSLVGCQIVFTKKIDEENTQVYKTNTFYLEFGESINANQGINKEDEKEVNALNTLQDSIQTAIDETRENSSKINEQNTKLIDLEYKSENLQSQINSTNDEINNVQTRIDNTDSKLSDIIDIIPNQANKENQLADKDFVNSSIATNTATFKGTFNTLTELKETNADVNDYGNVITIEEGQTYYNRYTYDGEKWVFNFKINNTTFTAEQWKALNSKATEDLISSISTNKENVEKIETEQEKQNKDIESNKTAIEKATEKLNKALLIYDNFATANASKMSETLVGNTTQATTTGKNILNMNDAHIGYFINDKGNNNENTHGFFSEEYKNVGTNKNIYYRIEAINDIILGRLWIQQYDKNKVSLSRTAFQNSDIYDTTMNAGNVRKGSIVLSENTTYVRISGYRLCIKNVNGEYEDVNFVENMQKNLKMMISFDNVDSYEPYTGGIPSPNPDYPQEIKNVTGDKIVSISDGTDSIDYPLSLADMELCKIEDYKDYIYYKDGKWWKHHIIGKERINSDNTIEFGQIKDGYRGILSSSLSNKFRIIDEKDLINVKSNYFEGITRNESDSVKRFGIAAWNTSGYMCSYSDTLGLDTIDKFKEWLNNNNAIAYIILATPTEEEITDTTLISQLNNILDKCISLNIEGKDFTLSLK